MRFEAQRLEIGLHHCHFWSAILVEGLARPLGGGCRVRALESIELCLFLKAGARQTAGDGAYRPSYVFFILQLRSVDRIWIRLHHDVCFVEED
jgi:hypothetical protein